MNMLNEPSIEDIKKIADEKRKMRASSAPAKKTRQPRQKKQPEPEPEIEDVINYEEREESEEEEIVEPVKAKKQVVKKQIAKKQSKKMIVVDDDDEEDDCEEIEQPLTRTKSYNVLPFKDIFNTLNNLKDLISSQKNDIIEAVKPKVPVEEAKKKKPKAKPKAKKVIKTLDLTVSDKEVEKIVSGNNTQPKAEDLKLKAFLEAFQKR